MHFDDPKREQLQGHLAGLARQADGAEADADGQPEGAEHDRLVDLAGRLRRGVERLREELETLDRPRPAGTPARADASARD